MWLSLLESHNSIIPNPATRRICVNTLSILVIEHLGCIQNASSPPTRRTILEINVIVGLLLLKS